MSASENQPLEIVRKINRLWQDRQIQAIAEFLHPDIVMILPGFLGRIKGVEAMLDGFEETILVELSEFSHEEDLLDATAVVSYRCSFTCERRGTSYSGMARDVWVFAKSARGWLAVFRTTVDRDDYDEF